MFTPEQIAVAQIVFDTCIGLGYSRESAMGVLGNLQAESGMNPHLNEDGGGGYGLGQWTPKENLFTQGALFGLSREQSDTAEGQATIIANGDVTGQWSVVASTRYGTQVITPQTLNEFKANTDITSNTWNFMAHWERPSYDPDINHIVSRILYAFEYNDIITGEGGSQICYVAPIKDTNLSESSFDSEQLYGFSASRRNNFHNGLDFGSIDHPGSEMLAVCDGVIKHIYDGTSNGLGWWYILSDVNFNFLYWESTMSRSDIKVNEGDTVKKGQVLSIRTTEHLHISVTKSIEYPLNEYLSNVYVDNGMWINPLTVLGQCFGGGTDPETGGDDYLILLLCDALNGWKW